MNQEDLPPPIFTMKNGGRCRNGRDACDPMDELVAELVAKYSPEGEGAEGTSVESVSQFSDEELAVDLGKKLRQMISTRNDPMPIDVSVLIVMKALRILRGKE